MWKKIKDELPNDGWYKIVRDHKGAVGLAYYAAGNWYFLYDCEVGVYKDEAYELYGDLIVEWMEIPS